MQAGLYIISTPIGNLGDITFRAVETLRAADVIACEDTRVSRVLLDKYGIRARTVALHDHNEAARIGFIESLVREGKAVALVSDAGTPLVSDPGYKLAAALRARGIYTTVVPGACSVIDALVLSGMPTDRFLFAGFAPAVAKARREFFVSLANVRASVIFFESAARLRATLTVIDEIFGGRQMTVARELTKLHEEVETGTAAELLAYFTAPKGEIVGVIAPFVGEETPSVDVEAMLGRLLPYMPLKEAAAFVADTFGLAKREVYQLGLALK
ncbi:MAG: 16S rRNA (cytidine(1402)-2'-O)-methyltransferase [Rickettsiales bacterium]|nr:16S rRNA (cytidine(1402)-2'-O)-methyltransferase [Rickettsiales bacterium]